MKERKREREGERNILSESEGESGEVTELIMVSRRHPVRKWFSPHSIQARKAFSLVNRV